MVQTNAIISIRRCGCLSAHTTDPWILINFETEIPNLSAPHRLNLSQVGFLTRRGQNQDQFRALKSAQMPKMPNGHFILTRILAQMPNCPAKKSQNSQPRKFAQMPKMPIGHFTFTPVEGPNAQMPQVRPPPSNC